MLHIYRNQDRVFATRQFVRPLRTNESAASSTSCFPEDMTNLPVYPRSVEWLMANIGGKSCSDAVGEAGIATELCIRRPKRHDRNVRWSSRRDETGLSGRQVALPRGLDAIYPSTSTDQWNVTPIDRREKGVQKGSTLHVQIVPVDPFPSRDTSLHQKEL